MKAADAFRWVLTALLLLIFVVVLFNLVNTWSNYALDANGKATGPDIYARAKETIALLSPLITLVLGYWFGVKGADAAKEGAETAKQDAAAAKKEAADAQKRVEAVLAAATPDIVASVEAKYPGMFGPNPPAGKP